MSVFNASDFDEHENVFFAKDQETGLKAIIAIHNTNLGPAMGGCRMYDYQSEDDALRDVLRLSKGMTYKAALAQLPLGGGKSVILGNPSKGKSEALFRAMGRFVNRLSGLYYIAQDSGTSVGDLQMVAKETGYVAGIESAVDDQNRVRTGDPSPATAYGVFVGIKAALKHKFGSDDLKGRAVAIQGVGNVGLSLAKHLHESGAELFVADVNQANLKQAESLYKAKVVASEDIYKQKVDVFSPCAMGAIINDRTIDQLQAPIVAGSANNQLETDAHGRILHEKGVLYSPDFVISAGGLIHVHFMRTQRTWAEATEHVDKIAETLEEIFARSRMQKETTSVIANQLARERIENRAVSTIHAMQGSALSSDSQSQQSMSPR